MCESKEKKDGKTIAGLICQTDNKPGCVKVANMQKSKNLMGSGICLGNLKDVPAQCMVL